MKIKPTKTEEEALFYAYLCMYDEYKKAKRKRHPFYAEFPRFRAL